MFALVEAPRLVGSHPLFQPAFRKFFLEQLLQLGPGLWIAAPTWMPRRPLVAANENVLLEPGHGNNVQEVESEDGLGKGTAAALVLQRHHGLASLAEGCNSDDALRLRD